MVFPGSWNDCVVCEVFPCSGTWNDGEVFPWCALDQSLDGWNWARSWTWISLVAVAGRGLFDRKQGDNIKQLTSLRKLYIYMLMF